MAATWTYEQAQTWLAGRTTVPSVLSSARLSLLPEFPARAKAQAFFSARVSTASILEHLREEIRRFAVGETDIASARMRLKTALAAQGIPADDVGMTDTPPPGVSEDDWRARKQIVNLGSTQRLDLIVRQNAAMAQAVGRREVSMDPAIRQRWPYFRYIARMDGRERPEHARLHNLVLPKDDPFWRTHTPPWDYNCRCDIEDADEGEAEALGVAQTAGTTVSNPGTGQTFQAIPNTSGYTFDIGAAADATTAQEYDWSIIKDAALREAAMEGQA